MFGNMRSIRSRVNTEELLGKKVMHIHSGEVGTVRGTRALDLDGTPAVYVEIASGDKRPPINRVWNVKEIEEV